MGTEEKKNGMKWLWWLVAALVIAAVVFFICKGKYGKECAKDHECTEQCTEQCTGKCAGECAAAVPAEQTAEVTGEEAPAETAGAEAAQDENAAQAEGTEAANDEFDALISSLVDNGTIDIKKAKTAIDNMYLNAMKYVEEGNVDFAKKYLAAMEKVQGMVAEPNKYIDRKVDALRKEIEKMEK